jgi:DNA repair protein RecN (Recombination protein N)
MLVEELKSLALPSVCFDLVFHPTGFTSEGVEEVEFLFSANPGEPVRPLAKVASGGELSRFLLALKVLTAEQGGMQSLIFDEIDTGMSGAAAKSVGEKLLRLARHLQVFVITHQPIVAAMGDHHLHVQKKVVAGEGEKPSKKSKAQTPATASSDLRVQVEVVSLEEKEKRLNVLSRLASGIDTDDEAVENYIHRLFHQADSWKTEKAAF